MYINGATLKCVLSLNLCMRSTTGVVMRLSVFFMFVGFGCSEYSLEAKVDNNLGNDSGVVEGIQPTPSKRKREMRMHRLLYVP